MNKYVRYLLEICLVLAIAGCGYPKVSGKVTFPDGSPLSKGKVVFEQGNNTFSGTISPDGTYRMGRNKEGDGIPKGEYRVALMGTMVSERLSVPEKKQPKPGDVIGPTPRPSVKFNRLVDRKYNSVETSGLSIDVSGTMTYDIVVEPPGKN